MEAIAEKPSRFAGWRDSVLPLGLGTCAALLVAGLLVLLPRLTPFAGLTLAVAGGIVIGWAGHDRRRRPGRERNGRWAGALPPGYRILHDVELPGMRADHVVIAPTGVWVVATPPQRGIVQTTEDGLTVDGRRLLRDPRRQACAAAAVVRDLLARDIGLRLRVMPVVCFPRATVIGRGPVAEAPVLGWAALLGLLRRGPHALPASLRARIRRALLRGEARRLPANKIHLVTPAATATPRSA